MFIRNSASGLIILLLLVGISYANDFTCSIQESGGDYNSISAWNTANECNIYLSTGTRVFNHGGILGVMPDGSKVWGAVSGSTGTLTHATTYQAMLRDIDGIFQSGEQIYKLQGSSYIIVSDSGNPVVAVAKIEGVWNTGEVRVGDSAVYISGWTTSIDNYIYVYTTNTARHSGVWDTTKYRIITGTIWDGSLNLTASHVRVDGLLIENNANGSGVSNVVGIRGAGKVPTLCPDPSDMRISNCIVVYNNPNPATDYGICVIENSSGVARVWNNLVTNYGSGISKSYGVTPSTIIYYNNTIIYSDRDIGGSGFRGFGTDNNIYLKNNLVLGGTACYNITSVIRSSNTNISNDATSPNTNYRNKSATYLSASTSNYFLASADTVAQGQGIDLTTDPSGWINMTTYIDGSAITVPGNIGAFPVGTLPVANPYIKKKTLVIME